MRLLEQICCYIPVSYTHLETLSPIPGLSGSAYLRGAMAGGIGWWLLV